jgi:hypothetical protein
VANPAGTVGGAELFQSHHRCRLPFRSPQPERSLDTVAVDPTGSELGPVAEDEQVLPFEPALNFLHASLAQSDRSVVPLEEEVRLVERYIAIQKARFGDRLSVELAIAPETLSVPVPRLLLQPLVENAVQHGTSLSVQGGWIRICTEKVMERVVISVINSSPAASRASPPPREGIGIGGIRARLSLLFGDTASISFSRPAEGQFLATVDLPVHPATPLPSEHSGNHLAGTTQPGDTAGGNTALAHRAPQLFHARQPFDSASPKRKAGYKPAEYWIWAAAWFAVVAAYVVVIGFERMVMGLPFAESTLQIVRRAVMVLPAALYSPLVLLALSRIRSQPRATSTIVLACSAVGVAYWLAWTLTLYGLQVTIPAPGRITVELTLPRVPTPLPKLFIAEKPASPALQA